LRCLCCNSVRGLMSSPVDWRDLEERCVSIRRRLVRNNATSWHSQLFSETSSSSCSKDKHPHLYEYITCLAISIARCCRRDRPMGFRSWSWRSNGHAGPRWWPDGWSDDRHRRFGRLILRWLCYRCWSIAILIRIGFSPGWRLVIRLVNGNCT
jgi:hypothetical protein